jgi:predicted nucleic acid-binding protein
LQKLFSRVLVPVAVIEELRHPAAPSAVATWVKNIPEWIEVRAIASQPESTLDVLDAGERDAIQLALEQRADLLLIDERKGRVEAKRRGIATTGTLGVLLAAGRRSLIDAETAYQRLVSETTFRASPEVRERFLRFCHESG